MRDGRRGQLGEDLVRQQPDVLGEHAEDQAIEEMRDALRLEPLGLQVVRQLTERFGGVLGDHQPGDARPQSLGIAERVLQQFPLRPVREIDELEDVNPLHGAGEVGVNLDPLRVAGDQKRRILQHVRVLFELQIRRVQVLSRPLVFPGERTLLPDVGPAVPADRRRAALLEGVGVAVRVRLRRRRLAEQRAQIQEMLLRRRPLRQVSHRPLVHELVWGQVDNSWVISAASPHVQARNAPSICARSVSSDRAL